MTNPNDPAGLIPWFDVKHSGLTKREWFAGLAMQGLHAMYANDQVDISSYSQKACASQAVIIADALIAELSKQPEK